ncbi:MBL fold metallo-hydrolase [Paracnuella aquatica]|uniref:MBL fold metallo-hydrolase n=1 Tax=Paracnuella aquatica TaxID=2268757 RepID=UPI000DEEB56D|nr:MBL fold metallo-hydrolase [Paracnuella aquatica]RPD44020.1 MBL fold metallo-hydrolase [Paracnuella aquatica]
MENNRLSVGAEQLRTWLEDKKDVIVLDVRPKEQREEWQIPGSIYLDAYQRLNNNDASVLDNVAIPENVPVVTVCAAGRTSMIAANELRKKGIEAYSLEGGMKAWSMAWNTAVLTFENFEVIQFRRTGKGCLSYMIISRKEAVIIDASLPVADYEQFLSERGITLKFVMDTHIHADHLSRSKQLAEKFNIPFYLPVQDKITFNFKPLGDNVTVTVGNISIRSIHSPGHTLESTSYLIDDKLLLTGDTLFIESIGRPDLKASPEEARHKASLLYHSLQKLIALNENIIVLPGHTSKPVEFNSIPIQASLSSIKQNVSMLHLKEEEFVQTILQRIPRTPANYLAIVEKNIKGEYDDVNPVELEAGANRCAIS